VRKVSALPSATSAPQRYLVRKLHRRDAGVAEEARKLLERRNYSTFNKDFRLPNKVE